MGRGAERLDRVAQERPRRRERLGRLSSGKLPHRSQPPIKWQAPNPAMIQGGSAILVLGAGHE